MLRVYNQHIFSQTATNASYFRQTNKKEMEYEESILNLFHILAG